MPAKAVTSAAAGTEDPSTSGEELSRVLYVGHIPHGFYEDQIYGYFSQFGRLVRVRVARSKKTGRSKSHAFVEFSSPEVARIAAQAMDGYFLFKQKLVCRVMKRAEVHEHLFRGPKGIQRFRTIPWQKLEIQRHNKVRTPQEETSRTQRAVRRDAARQKRIKDAGIDYEYSGLADQPQAQRPKHVMFDED